MTTELRTLERIRQKQWIENKLCESGIMGMMQILAKDLARASDEDQDIEDKGDFAYHGHVFQWAEGESFGIMEG
jgi:hypothetical protein